MDNCIKNKPNNDYSKNKNEIVNHKLYFIDKPNIVNFTYSAVNGKLNGEHLMFDKKEKLISKSFYKNGVLDGIKTDYNVFMFVNNEIIKVKKYEQTYENGVEIATNVIL